MSGGDITNPRQRLHILAAVGALALNPFIPKNILKKPLEEDKVPDGAQINENLADPEWLRNNSLVAQRDPTQLDGVNPDLYIESTFGNNCCGFATALAISNAFDLDSPGRTMAYWINEFLNQRGPSGHVPLRKDGRMYMGDVTELLKMVGSVDIVPIANSNPFEPLRPISPKRTKYALDQMLEVTGEGGLVAVASYLWNDIHITAISDMTRPEEGYSSSLTEDYMLHIDPMGPETCDGLREGNVSVTKGINIFPEGRIYGAAGFIPHRPTDIFDFILKWALKLSNIPYDK
jgi:hypothetical protein